MLNHYASGPSRRTRRWALPFVAVSLAVVISACSSTTGSAVTGSGNLRTESRDVGGFSTIELTGSGNVIIEQTGTESLSIEAEDNLLPDLTSDVSSGTLELGTTEGTDLQPTLPITYRVTVHDLAGLQMSGSGSVTAAGITTSAISIDISGSGDVTLAGTADDQTVTISGSGNYRAGDLATRNSTAAISGSGTITVDASDVLEAEISGSGDVSYIGDPQISQDISGSGELRRAE
jgi:Putative auto-transporter adhesin, head GIN domain